MKFIKSLTLIALFFAVSCVTSPPTQKSNLTYATVKKNLIKGQTAQSEVIRLLGSPNVISKNRSGNEVWTYSKQSTDSSSGSFGGGLIFFGGSKAVSSNSASTFDLIVTFTKNDIVEDYSVVSSQF